jgi:hypothetical protein
MNERIEKLFENVCVNEQIKQLAEQAGCTIDRLGYGEGNLEKFAELIVRECVQMCEGNGEYKNHVDTEWGKGLADGIELCKEVMKQHFGVKE